MSEVSGKKMRISQIWLINGKPFPYRLDGADRIIMSEEGIAVIFSDLIMMIPWHSILYYVYQEEEESKEGVGDK